MRSTASSSWLAAVRSWVKTSAHVRLMLRDVEIAHAEREIDRIEILE